MNVLKLIAAGIVLYLLWSLLTRYPWFIDLMAFVVFGGGTIILLYGWLGTARTKWIMVYESQANTVAVLAEAELNRAKAARELMVVVKRDDTVFQLEDGQGRWYARTLKAPEQPYIEIEQPRQLPAPMEPILPRLVAAQRLIIAGGSDAGKTTLIKHIIAGRADHSKIIPIDPHAPSKLLGYDVIGAGRDYAAIERALESLLVLMTARYQDVKAGDFQYGQHERVSVFIDEWTGIVREIRSAGDMLATLLTESRKVNIHLALCCHSTTVDALGLPDAQIRKSATVVEITGGNDGTPRRAFIHPASKTNPDGSKALPQEYALPGPFVGYVQPAGEIEVVSALPEARVIRAVIDHQNGVSDTAIAKAFYQVKRPNAAQIADVRALFGDDKLTTNLRQ